MLDILERKRKEQASAEQGQNETETPDEPETPDEQETPDEAERDDEDNGLPGNPDLESMTPEELFNYIMELFRQ